MVRLPPAPAPLDFGAPLEVFLVRSALEEVVCRERDGRMGPRGGFGYRVRFTRWRAAAPGELASCDHPASYPALRLLEVVVIVKGAFVPTYVPSELFPLCRAGGQALAIETHRSKASIDLARYAMGQQHGLVVRVWEGRVDVEPGQYVEDLLHPTRDLRSAP